MSEQQQKPRPRLKRRASSLQSLNNRKNTNDGSAADPLPLNPVDLMTLMRVYFLDGSSKVLQGKASSTVKDLLHQLQFNLDLSSVKTFALFRVSGETKTKKKQMRRLELWEKMTEVMQPEEGEDVKVLMRSWIHDEEGAFDKQAMQEGIFPKAPNAALFLKYTEAVCMVMRGRCYLTEDESVMLGCLKMQVDSGDYNSSVHTMERMQNRIAMTFPSPVKEKMNQLLELYAPGQVEQLTARVQLLYSRLAGYSKAESQIEYLRTLRIWCPFYSASFFSVECQYDDSPEDPQSQPPVVKMSAGISKNALYLITQSSPPVILRQPYNRIVKWTSHPEMNIFCYWILKSEYTPKKVESIIISEDNNDPLRSASFGEEDAENISSINPSRFCDCVYLVSDYTEEIALVFSSYINLIRNGTPPLLPTDDPDEQDTLKDDNDKPEVSISSEPTNTLNNKSDSSVKGTSQRRKEETSTKRGNGKRSSIFSKLFLSASDNNQDDDDDFKVGGIVDDDFEEAFYDADAGTVPVSGSDELFPPLSESNIDILNGGTGEIQMAATMEELNQLTFKDFLDDDEDDDEADDDEDSDNSSAPKEQKDLSNPPPPPRRKSLFKWS